MHLQITPLILVAGLAVGCRSANTNAPSIDATTKSSTTPAPKPNEPPAAQPMAPLLVRRATPAPTAPTDVTANSTRADRLAALTKEYDDATTAYWNAFEKALGDNENPSREEMQKIRAQLTEPDPKSFETRARQLLDEDASDVTALRAIQWMFANTSRGEANPELVAMLEKHHLDRPEMGEMCSMLGGLGGDARGLLEKLLARSPHADVRGQACYALAEALKSDIESAEFLKLAEPKELAGMKESMGEAKFAALQSLDVAKTNAAIEAYYERIVNEFGDIKVGAGTKRETTLGKRASAALFEARTLAVGKPAPEIEGVDLDKVAFKLSDYRGKVVLLDFWGNW